MLRMSMEIAEGQLENWRSLLERKEEKILTPLLQSSPLKQWEVLCKGKVTLK